MTPSAERSFDKHAAKALAFAVGIVTVITAFAFWAGYLVGSLVLPGVTR